MASRDHQLYRLYRLRSEFEQLDEDRGGTAEVNGRNAAQLVIQRQAQELRHETERLLAVSMRLYGQPDREG